MVKVSETIICQRFVQNAWKKDLCSNCFKSKEDHHLVAEKKISYRWTSHINNFPQHSILKGHRKNHTSKSRSVSFHSEETEIIGFGGEEVSSDDEYYPTFGEEKVTIEMDTEEDKTFRKLTQSNTDFNSVPANLKCDRPDSKVQSSEVANTYSNLELGKPLIDADGYRKTLQVSVEPFRTATVGTLRKNGDDNKRNQEADSTIEKTENNKNNAINNGDCNKKNNSRTNNKENNTSSITAVAATSTTISSNNNNSNDDSKNSNNNINDYSSNNCDTKLNSVEAFSKTSDSCNNACSPLDNFTGMLNVEVTETINEGVYAKKLAENDIDIKKVDTKYSAISNVSVDSITSVDGGKSCENDVIENMKTAKTILEPIFRLNNKREDKPKLSIYQSSIDLKEKRCSMNKDCNPINLPLIMSKELEIELDKPGSRELVGEPDGKADSDDSYDTLKTEETKLASSTDPSQLVNPQRSFLHAFKPKPATKPGSLDSTSPTRALSSDNAENTTPVPQTPKIPVVIASCPNTGSTKRQAPKPPSPKSAPSTPMLMKSVKTPVLVMTPDDPLASETTFKKLESSLLNGKRDTVSFPDESLPSSGVQRRLHLEPVAPKNRNSICVLMTPNGTGVLKQHANVNGLSDRNSDSGDATSISSSEYAFYEPANAVKCSRSLSCDSISPTNGLQSELNLPEKTRKYVEATIRMKSTLKKFLRFNSKDEDKSDSENAAPVAPRRRIEIIHPIDLNKSSIEILGPQVAISDHQLDDAKKITESSKPSSPAVIESNYMASSTIRPNKPPPPPRNQSLEQKLSSEISKPARPPPPKSGMFKSPASKPALCLSSSNTYENLGESRQNIAPAKPQRASSMRDRARQTSQSKNTDETSLNSELESEAVPECDQLRLQQYERQSSEVSDKPITPLMTHSDSEPESDLFYQFINFKTTSSNHKPPEIVLLDSKTRKMRAVNHSAEDNYSAIVVTNHETLSSFLDQVNQATLIPRTLEKLRTTVHIQFNHFNVVESSRACVTGWHFYNAKYAGQDVVISLSNKPLEPTKSFPPWITLFPIIKFTDVIPSRFMNEDAIGSEMNAYVTVWNGVRVESLTSFVKRCENSNSAAFDGNLLLFLQLTNVLKHVETCGVENISLDDMLVCKREADTELKLVLIPMSVTCDDSAEQNKQKLSLCACATTVLEILLPKQHVTDFVKKALSDKKTASLSQAKAIAEYWLWGPRDVTLTNDRLTSLQRWLDLERAAHLYKVICRKPEQFNLNERCHMMFLVHANVQSLTEASYILEKTMM